MWQIFKRFQKGRSARRIIHLGWPLVLAGLSQALIVNIDAAMVGRVSIEALAALGVSSTVLMFFIIVGNSLSFGLNALISIEMGARNPERAARNTIVGLQLGVLLGVGLTFATQLIFPVIFKIMGLKGEVLQLSLEYMRIACFMLLFSPTYSALCAIFNAYTSPRSVFFSSILMLITNTVGNYALIFGRLGCPELGISGAAIATTFSMLAGMMLLGINLWLRRNDFALDHPNSEIRFFDVAPRIAQFGGTVLIDHGVWFSGMLVLNALLARLGAAELALFNVGLKLSSLCFVYVGGTMCASSAMISRAIGKKSPARILVWTSSAVWICLLSLVPGILLLVLFPKTVLRIYITPEDMALLSHFQIVGIALAALLVVRVFNTILSVTLRSMGMLRFSIICVFSSFTLLLAVSTTTIGWLRWGALAAFFTCFFEEGLRVILYTIRYRRSLHVGSKHALWQKPFDW